MRRRPGARRRATRERRSQSGRADERVELLRASSSRTRSSTRSGTFDAIAARRAFGEQLLERFPFAAFVSKTVTVAPRQGNPPPRLWELRRRHDQLDRAAEQGAEGYLEHDLPQLAALPVPLIVNVMGFCRDEVATLVRAFGERDEVAALELNVSCPNVETGLVMGADPREIAALLERVRPLTGKPLIVKLTPNATDVPAVARAAQEAGRRRGVADQHDPRHGAGPGRPGEPWLGGITGGVSGPAVRAVALAQVHSVAAAVSIPVVGMGGVQRGARRARSAARRRRLLWRSGPRASGTRRPPEGRTRSSPSCRRRASEHPRSRFGALPSVPVAVLGRT